MKAKLCLMMMLALSASTLVACGGDDTDTPEGGAGGTSGGDGDGDGDQDAGGGTSGGGTGGGGTGGTGGTGPQPVACGAKMCQPPANPFEAFSMFLGGMELPIMAYACCLDEAAEECGYSPTADGASCSPPAEPDTRCPDFELGFGGGQLPIQLPPVGVGCCTNNQCGVDGQLFGQGCVENSEAETMIAAQPMIGAFLVDGVPDPRACDAPPDTDGGDVGEDAGN